MVFSPKTLHSSSANASLEGDVVQPWGEPNSEAIRMFFNFGYELSSVASLYAFGDYSESKADGGFFYRFPGNGTIEDLRQEDGSIYSPLSKFLGGFTPRFFGDVSDYSIVAGIKGKISSALSYDISGRHGSSTVEYTLKNTINPSLGAASPTSFRPGDLENEETQIQLDFAYEFDAGLSSPAIFAFGLSYLDESYDVVTGELDSYQAGPHASSDPFGFCSAGIATTAGAAVIANADDPSFTVVGVGSNGFPGYSPAFSDLYERDSYALYVDVSADVTEDLFLQAALRYEDYSDFNSEVVGKVAMQCDINEIFGLRASFGTGFRATPGQQGTTNVSTRLPNGVPVATGLFPALSTVSQALGADALKPETSTSYTFGVTGEFDKLSVTLDFYRIDIEHRFYAISTLGVSTDPTSPNFANFQALQSAGVAGAETIGGVFYFTNAFDTKTTGMDLVATYPLEWSNGSVTSLSASMNYNKSESDSDPSVVLNAEDQFDFENNVPEWRSVFTATQTFDKLTVVGRASYYGESENSNSNGAPLNIQKFDSEIFADLEGSYQINE
ncbi:MAG: iron complex outermembrane receptor protein [Candidatus Azotimanducaceae bacterium]|jgi:iron complex outermembrane receptor protein